MTKLELIGLLADLSILGGVIIMLLCMPIMIYFAYKEHKAEQQTAQAEQETAQAEQEPEDGEIILSEEEIDLMLKKYDRLLSDYVDIQIERDLYLEAEQRYKNELEQNKCILSDEVARREYLTVECQRLRYNLMETEKLLEQVKADYENLSNDYAELEQKANEK